MCKSVVWLIGRELLISPHFLLEGGFNPKLAPQMFDHYLDLNMGIHDVDNHFTLFDCTAKARHTISATKDHHIKGLPHLQQRPTTSATTDYHICDHICNNGIPHLATKAYHICDKGLQNLQQRPTTSEAKAYHICNRGLLHLGQRPESGHAMWPWITWSTQKA